jgi:hypothetical protein
MGPGSISRMAKFKRWVKEHAGDCLEGQDEEGEKFKGYGQPK